MFKNIIKKFLIKKFGFKDDLQSWYGICSYSEYIYLGYLTNDEAMQQAKAIGFKGIITEKLYNKRLLTRIFNDKVFLDWFLKQQRLGYKNTPIEYKEYLLFLETNTNTCIKP